MLRRPPASLTAVTRRYLGRSFAEMPCLELVVRIYRDDLGLAFPEEFAGVTREDYLAQWRRRRRGMESLLLRFARTIGAPVEVGRPRRWDLLVLMGATRSVYPAVYTGRGYFLTSTLREGVVVCPIDRRNRPLMARRMI